MIRFCDVFFSLLGLIVLSPIFVIIALCIVAGTVGGYLYWRYVGCTTGTCPITSSPVNSSIWGAAMGGLLLSSFIPERKEIKKEE